MDKAPVVSTQKSRRKNPVSFAPIGYSVRENEQIAFD
jgi:hypothetical protein